MHRICSWSSGQIACVLCIWLSSTAPAGAADPETGGKLFRSQCTPCHSDQPGRNMTGPSLSGVLGRGAGQVEGFRYSDANRKSGLTWDADTLERYLASPRGVVPGTLMTYPGLKDADKRASLIAYLGTLK